MGSRVRLRRESTLKSRHWASAGDRQHCPDAPHMRNLAGWRTRRDTRPAGAGRLANPARERWQVAQIVGHGTSARRSAPAHLVAYSDRPNGASASCKPRVVCSESYRSVSTDSSFSPGRIASTAQPLTDRSSRKRPVPARWMNEGSLRVLPGYRGAVLRIRRVNRPWSMLHRRCDGHCRRRYA